MPGSDTKQKIINASVNLFNESGVSNVRLQQIADKTGISVGNLAYHFKNKAAILEAVHENIEREVQKILATYRTYPNLIDFDHQLNQYFYFLKKYPFYFLDLMEIERTYPALNTDRKKYINRMLQQIRKRFDFNIQRGIIREEFRPGLYDAVAHAIWMVITFWMSQQLARGENPDCIGKFKQIVWAQILPYLTPEGLQEYDHLIVPLLSHHEL